MITNTVQLGEGEDIVHVVHRHWFHLVVVGAVDVFVLCAVLLGASVAGFMLGGGDIPVLSGERSFALTMFFVAGVGLLLWMHFFAAWTDTWLDTWIITNKRIIDIEQRAFFSREVSIIPLERVQDVTSTVQGLVATWLDFGDVKMHTASDGENFVMRQVPYPETVKEHLMRVLEEHKR